MAFWGNLDSHSLECRSPLREGRPQNKRGAYALLLHAQRPYGGYVPLRDGPDEALIEQGMIAFFKANRDRFDGFEVWRKERCLYRSRPKTCESAPSPT